MLDEHQRLPPVTDPRSAFIQYAVGLGSLSNNEIIFIWKPHFSFLLQKKQTWFIYKLDFDQKRLLFFNQFSRQLQLFRHILVSSSFVWNEVIHLLKLRHKTIVTVEEKICSAYGSIFNGWQSNIHLVTRCWEKQQQKRRAILYKMTMVVSHGKIMVM